MEYLNQEIFMPESVLFKFFIWKIVPQCSGLSEMHSSGNIGLSAQVA